jgi:peptide/nickel transport system permease protein
MADNVSTNDLPPEPEVVEATRKTKRSGTVERILKYTATRLVTLFVTVLIGVYLSILIANMGGYVDEIRRGQIREEVSLAIMARPESRRLTPEERNELVDRYVKLEEDRLGLDRPFILRSFSYLWSALSLNLGRAEYLTSDSGSRKVRLVILERLPSTLLLFATAQLLLFFLAVFVALFLSRRYGSRLDKIMVALAPTSAAPPWFYGLFLILIFSIGLQFLPFRGMVSAPPPREPWLYALSVLEHLILPVAAIVIAAVFLAIYSWRTFFLIYSSEDYVEMAKAKGLTSGAVERQYILRPTLPTIVTNFALTLIALWTGSITLETVFDWPGLGRLIYQAIGLRDTPVIIGSVVIYAYLLAVTVFTLDVLYALIDPRVKVGVGGSQS